MFNLSSEQQKEYGAVNTTREIHHQPSVWAELVTDFFKNKATYNKFLNSIYAKHDKVRVILTGAGSSAYVGDTLVPELSKIHGDKVSFEAIATTDIVSNPTEYLINVPTILVSFARSGNSPESVATVSLGQELIDDFYQVVVTCNKDGELAKSIIGDPNSIIMLMPERSNDKSLAMTSSYSSMVLGAFALFTNDKLTEDIAKQLISSTERVIEKLGNFIQEIISFKFDRVVYLGSGLLGELAKEAALKMLELSDGQVVTLRESSLGFRHGPKSILTDESLVVLFMSQNPYTRKYDLDILRELAAAENGMRIVVLTEQEDKEVEELADWVLTVNDHERSLGNDFYLSLIYVVFAQTLALKKSIDLGITPDNPSADGAINRVVKGVTIYNFDL